MKASRIPFVFLFVLVFSTSCENLEKKLQDKVNLINEKAASLDSLMNKELLKVNSLDSLINRELDKVDSLDAMINRELEKVNSLDSLLNKTSTTVDSLVQGKGDRINRIVN